MLVIQSNIRPGEAAVTLTYQPTLTRSGEERIAIFDLYVTNALSNFENLGATVRQLEKPTIEGEIEENYYYKAILAMPDNRQLVFRAYSKFFEKCIFHFLVIGPDSEEADKLLECHQSLKRISD